MFQREFISKLDNSEEFDRPRCRQSVWPHQVCPKYQERGNSLAVEPTCYFCKYADFHLNETVALEVGICCWPEVQLE